MNQKKMNSQNVNSRNTTNLTMTLLKSIFLLIGLGMIAGLVACSSSSSTTTTTPPAITVSLSSTPTSLFVNDTASVTATVANDSANAGVTWSCAPAGSCGSFSSTTTASGAAVTYTAPATVPSGTVTITATSVTNTAISATSPAITINPASGITVTLTTAPPASLATSATATIAATVANDSANGGVTWSCIPSGSCGSFNPTSTASAGTTVYTAPSAVPSGNTVTITATSVSDNSISASATVTITAVVGVSPLPDGNYVFNLAGQNAGPGYLYFATGVFSVASGVVTGGEQDFTDFSGNNEAFDSIASGTLATTADGNIQIVLTTCTATDCSTPDPVVGVGGVETLTASMIDATDFFVSEADTSATASGLLNFQTATNQPCTAFPCGYSFYLNGADSEGVATDFGGVVAVTSSGEISGAGSVVDIDDGGDVFQGQPISSGSVSTPDSFGRFSVDLAFGGTAAAEGGIGLVGYIIDGTRVRLIENANDINDIFFGVTGGTALAQGVSTGTFDAASIEGASFAFAGNGQDNSGYLQVAGVMTTNLDGSTVNGTLNANDLTGSGVQAPQAFTGTYTVDPTGRVTLDLTSVGLTLQLYLSGGETNFVAAMDDGDSYAGPAFVQTTPAGSYSASNFSGNYAFSASGYQFGSFGLEFDAIGTLAASESTVTGTVDENVLDGAPTTGIALTDGFTANASGIFTGTVTGLDLANGTQDSFAYYLFDSSGDSIAIETDANQLTLGYIQLQ
jgi:hypothetical protein